MKEDMERQKTGKLSRKKALLMLGDVVALAT